MDGPGTLDEDEIGWRDRGREGRMDGRWHLSSAEIEK
jgi:hypothetical protein